MIISLRIHENKSLCLHIINELLKMCNIVHEFLPVKFVCPYNSKTVNLPKGSCIGECIWFMTAVFQCTLYFCHTLTGICLCLLQIKRFVER